MLPGEQPWGGSGEQCKCPGDLRAWISVHEGDIKDTAEGIGIGESGHQSDWVELYWVSVLTPRNETMFSRRCSMAPLPTQVCILVEACLALCKTKAVESFLGIRPCWEVRNPRRMCSMQGLGGPLRPAVLWQLARKMPGSIHCQLDKMLCLCMKIRLGQIVNQRQPPPQPRVPYPAQRALSDGIGKIHTRWKIYFSFSSYFPSPHCQSAC